MTDRAKAIRNYQRLKVIVAWLEEIHDDVSGPDADIYKKDISEAESLLDSVMLSIWYSNRIRKEEE